MKRWRRGAFCGVACVLALAITGCDVHWVTVVIPDFQSKKVQGVWVWVSSGAGGTFSHALQVPVPQQIASPTGPAAGTGQWQTVLDSAGQQQFLFVTGEPDPANPDGVTVQIGFVMLIPTGYVKVSSFNAAGESPMSEGETSL